MDGGAERRGRRAFYATVAAFLLSVALVVAALVVPVYSGVSQSTSSGIAGIRGVVHSSSLVGGNGLWVLIPVAVPAVLTALVWIALHWKCSRNSHRAGVVAWVMVGLLCAFCVIGAFSIGLVIVPVAALLAYATSLTPAGTA